MSGLGLRLGLLRAMHKILRIKRSGLLCCGLPCKSWVFLNTSPSERRPLRIFGTPKFAYAKRAKEHLDCRLYWRGLGFRAGSLGGLLVISVLYPDQIKMLGTGATSPETT